jgi:hypothetical protein
MAIEKLRHIGALKMVLNVAVFNLFPKFLGDANKLRKGQINVNFLELGKLRSGLDTLAKHWEK